MSFLGKLLSSNVVAAASGVSTGFLDAQKARAKEDALDARAVKTAAAQMKAILARSDASIKAATLAHNRNRNRDESKLRLKASLDLDNQERKQRLIILDKKLLGHLIIIHH